MSETALEVIQPSRMEVARASEPLGVEEILAQVNLIQSVMHKVMKENEHYGTIPGCGDKKTLLQPGAQKLTMTFRLAPEYVIQETDLMRGHKEYRVICTLKSIQSGTFVGQGVGCCSSMESKYRWRGGARKCPKCGKETIIKGKAEYGGGWLCFGKKGGCGAKWNDGAAEIESQNIEKVENDNPADTFNTVLKMAKKRAFVDATITATAASDIFTQDVGDDEAEEPQREPEAKPTRPAQQSAPKPFSQRMPKLAPTTTPLAPAPAPSRTFKNASDRKAQLDAFLLRCKLKLVSDLERGDPQQAVEFMQKAGHLMPNETAISEANELTVFPSVRHEPAVNETDGEWWALVGEAVAKDALAIKRAYASFQNGGQLEGATVGHEAEPAPLVPVIPDGAKEMAGFVKLVNKKPTAKGGTKYGILIVQDLQDREGGEWLNTFDDKDGVEAERLKGQEVAVAYTDGQYGKDLCKHAIREVR